LVKEKGRASSADAREGITCSDGPSPTGISANPCTVLGQGPADILPKVSVCVGNSAARDCLLSRLPAFGFAVTACDPSMPGCVPPHEDTVRIVDELPTTASTVPFLVIAPEDRSFGPAEAVRAGAFGYLVPPFDIASLAAAIQIAAARARLIAELTQRTENLSSALQLDQTTSAVVGILMQRYHLSQEEAFERLRTYARTRRLKVADVSQQVLAHVNALHRALMEFDKNDS
jgi:DNA-binding NarL/FixJ family response regulator